MCSQFGFLRDGGEGRGGLMMEREGEDLESGLWFW